MKENGNTINFEIEPTSGFECEIESTSAFRAAMKELQEIAEDSQLVMYGQDQSGKIFPIAMLMKHPDCPDELFRDFLRIWSGNDNQDKR